ncbi:MAG: hypothetical protein IPM31_18980 [Anaerolineae bacterium]|jgi:hypothetical protein|nr:hypothetical protein [Anaerolineae bacterium]MBL8105328.1 hypothetical protein [Anaerolineales bacterium]MCC7188113.1 hypothetical protein [Anaerolineales bacterium]
MNEIVFKPKHNWFSIVFLGLLIISLGGAALVVGYVTGDNAILVLGVLFVLMGLYSIGRRSTLIVIGNAEVEMKRLFLPTVALDYENFTDFTGAAFMFGNKGIPLDDMTNAQEFVEIFAPVLEGQKVRSTGKYVADVNRTNKALKYAAIPSIVITLAATYILKGYFKLEYDGKLVGGLIFIVILFVIYFGLQKLEEYNKEK